jgi:arsenate reductase-like glutaredoxin family protein
MKQPQKKKLVRKLVRNGRWESSRMMLPQHIAAMRQEESKKLKRPILTEDEQAYISGLIRIARDSCLDWSRLGM